MTSSTLTEVVIKAPEFRGGNFALGANRDIEVCLDGPAGTGKTYAALYKIHMMLTLYRGAKALVARKSNTALSGSAMATFREMLDPREGVLYFGGNKVKPAAFEYPNGSLLLVNGLDKPEKVKSWEFSIAYINEATECSPEDIEFVRSRLRQGKTPYPQLVLDCNPDAPMHWLNVRMDKGITTRLKTFHEDNPRYFDGVRQDWTEAGREYIFQTLEGLTGVRYQRLRLGKWVAAEGMVYEDWDTTKHVATRSQLVEWGVLNADETVNRSVIKRVLASVDWGFTNPGVILVWGLDGDGRLYLLRQLYRTGKVIDWWMEQGKALRTEFGIELFVCDPSEPAYIAQFNEHGLRAVGAVNDIAPGVSAVQARLKVVGDGRARLFVYEYSLQERDEKRAGAHEPYCVEQEIAAYVWPQSRDGQAVKEVPVKINDHAMDALRYMCMHLVDPTPSADKYLETMKQFAAMRTGAKQ